MSFIRRVLIAGVTTSALAAATLVAPSSGQAPRPVIASTKAAGTAGLADVAVRPSGRAAVVLNSAGLTKYALGSSSVRRLGTVKIWKHGVPDGGHDGLSFSAEAPEVHVHPAGRFAYVVWDKAVRVFDITGSTPRAVRTLTAAQVFGDNAEKSIWDAVFAPDGRSLYVLSRGSIQVLDVRRPAHPTRGVRTAYSTSKWGGGSLAVTPDGSSLVAGGVLDDAAHITVFTLSRTGAPFFARQSAIAVDEWPEADAYINDLVAQNSSVYVGVGAWEDDLAVGDVVRMRLADLSVVDRAAKDAKRRLPFVQATSNDARRVYLTRGYVIDDPEVHLTRQLVWTDARLGGEHAIAGVGDVGAVAVSPGGRTRGKLVVVAKTSRGLRLELVKAP